MKDEEKNLIENLFHRLKKTELNSSERDNSADDLIQELVKKQPASSYYMTQTILVQETAIKKMSIQIEELKKRIEELKLEEVRRKPSFLSNFFKNNSSSQPISHDNNIWRNQESPVQSYNPHAASFPATTPVLPRSSGFLSNALQTATGVAGGMILGNMLMNVFNHTTPEEEIFNNINKSNIDLHKEDSSFNHSNSNNLVDYEQKESSEMDKSIHHNESDSNNINYMEDVHDIENHTSDIDDDNFI